MPLAEMRRMERFTADAIKAERDSAIKHALKVNVPWPDIVNDYGVTLEYVMDLAGANPQKGVRRGSAVIYDPSGQVVSGEDIVDAREEVSRGRR